MRLLLFLVAIWILSTADSHAQIPGRYIDEVFSNVTETNDVVFSTSVPQPENNNFNFYSIITGLPVAVKEYDTEDVTLWMDIFEPEGDLVENRPVVIICFGGGFVQGSRDYWSIRLLAQGLAKRGYVTAAIDYRLGMNLFDKDLGARAVYRAVQDSRSAVRFFRANASQYRIDPNRIFIGGHSAGAFVALHNLYLDQDAERPPSTRIWTQNSMNDCPDLGGLDSAGDNLGVNGKANGIFSLAGAIGDLAYMESMSEAPPLLFHSSDDGTVPYGEGEPFSDISGLIIGSDLPTVFGSSLIKQRADDLTLPVDFRSYTNRGHGVHENGTMALHDDILPAIGSWFFTQHLEPSPSEIDGSVRFCSSTPEITYNINGEDFSYVDWTVEGGSVTAGNPNSNTIEIEWNANATIRSLSARGYLANGAGALLQTLEISKADESVNYWEGEVSDRWDEAGNWSLGQPPLECEEVVISENANILLAPTKTYRIATLTLSPQSQITIPANSKLLIGNE